MCVLCVCQRVILLMIQQNSVTLVTVCTVGRTLMDPHHGIQEPISLFFSHCLSRSCFFVSLRFTDAVALSVINVFFIKRGQKLLIINSGTENACDLRQLNTVKTSAFIHQCEAESENELG